MKRLLTTKEVAQFLDVNEKMVYALVADKGLPASKITGKWLFPTHLVQQWVETHTLNYPENGHLLPPYHGLLILAGSNDPLLERTIGLFNDQDGDQVAVFGNLGSMGGLRALRQGRCHMAACHLLQDNEREYNFDYATREFEQMPVVVNFCRREQGIVLAPGNPKGIRSIKDLARKGIRIVNRSLSTGTRLLLDRELKKAGVKPEKLAGYDHEVPRHLDVGLEVLSGRAHAGPAIRPVASLLGLEFLPIRWERYDFLISKERFFDQGVQAFLALLHEKDFRTMAESYRGYDVGNSGRMLFPYQNAADGDTD
ncbi:MAG: helix-turn-helix transcriptional regulator [Desulfosarcinaceae bacterium]|nr:helix-turn-helix transcriptional regulator [Desulfosarcinaceae bacterium]